jgi:hypothetical protein
MKARRTGYDRTVLAMNDEDAQALVMALAAVEWGVHPVAAAAIGALNLTAVDVDTFMKDGPLEDQGPDKFDTDASILKDGFNDPPGGVWFVGSRVGRGNRIPLPRELKAEAERLLARMERGKPLIGGETPRALALRLAVESRRGMGDASGTVRAAEAFLAFLEGGE